MTLYDSILEYERNETTIILDKVSNENLLMKISIELIRDKAIDSDVTKSKIILDTAYKLQDSKISDQKLDYLVNELNNIDDQAFGVVPTNSKILAARKDWIKAKVEFYQQIVHQTTENFEDAIKKQFNNESAYREALQPYVKAEAKMYNVLKTVTPASAKAMDDSLNATLEVRETAINYLFKK